MLVENRNELEADRLPHKQHSLRMGGAINLLPPYAFMALQG
jgi:hypothetical protein